MSFTNSRLKGFGFGKRRSTASIQSSEGLPQSQTPPPSAQTHIPQIQPPRPGPAPSIASNSSQQSIQMNHPGAGQRPPSYTAGYPGKQLLSVPPYPSPALRPASYYPRPKAAPADSFTGPGPARTPPSQMVGGPPPINTGAPVPGYPPPMQMQGGPPVPGGPPGYTGGAGYPPPAPPQGQPLPTAPYARPAAEVEGNSRSKAQLIVGIDFVSLLPETCSFFSLSSLLTPLCDIRARHSPVWLSHSLPTTRRRRILSQNGLVPVHTQNRR